MVHQAMPGQNHFRSPLVRSGSTEGPHNGPYGPAEKKAAGPDAARNNRDCLIPSLKDVRHRLSSPSSPVWFYSVVSPWVDHGVLMVMAMMMMVMMVTTPTTSAFIKLMVRRDALYASITACESKQKSEQRERDGEQERVCVCK
uniref:Uncharacterized protein n=1 Tax=Anopheles merus TaxID=30066 RepID=A0A182UUE7_ANOME